MDWKTLFFKADGRIGKKDFWIGAIILWLLNLTLGQVENIGWLVSAVTLWGMVCVYAKRLHDFGKTGWLVLLPVAVSILSIIVGLMAMIGGGALGSVAGSSGAAAGALAGAGLLGLLMLLAFVVNIGFIIWVGTRPSDPDTNQFGPPPEVPLVTAI